MKLRPPCGQSVAEEMTTGPSCGGEIGEDRRDIDDSLIVDVLHEGYCSFLCRAIHEPPREHAMIRLFTQNSGVNEEVATPKILRATFETVYPMPSTAPYILWRSANPLRLSDIALLSRDAHGRRLLLAVAVVLLALSSTSCGVMIHQMADVLVSGNSVYATDDDLDLVWEAVPFALKSIEGLLIRTPKSKKLLLAASSGFTQYGYAHLQQDADYLEAHDLAAATALRSRASKMYRRALDYGLRGLEVDVPNFRLLLQKDPQAAVRKLRKTHVPLIYWTANAWGAAISLSKDDPELAADQNLVEALMRRALALDEAWERGSIHDFFISYEGGRASIGGSLSKAREHFDRAMQFAQGTRVVPLVNFAETVSVSTQNKKQFQGLLEKALAFDTNESPETRVANLVAQRRAKWLLGRIDELFVE